MTKKEINKRTGRAFDDNSRAFIDWTDKYLKERLRSAYSSIVVTECYGVGDCICEIGCTNELDARGYDVDWEEDRTTRLIITKREEDNED